MANHKAVKPRHQVGIYLWNILLTRTKSTKLGFMGSPSGKGLMRLILIFPQMGKQAEDVLIEWAKGKMEDQEPLWKYVEKLEMEE